jgi:hypothetical protein
MKKKKEKKKKKKKKKKQCKSASLARTRRCQTSPKAKHHGVKSQQCQQ